ncbi:hypothetical protein BGZ46_010693 [Entomortierella lignicola]|nr:hypothetical protein BGZ46_010693 [Entomortierella lignicola]
MNEKGDISIPVYGEEATLLGNHQAPQGCTRGIIGKHENSKKRVLLRRSFAALLLVWLYWSIYGHHRPSGLDSGVDYDGGHGGGHGGHGGHGRHGDQCDLKELVPWNGTSEFETSARNIDFRFGKGNLFTKVEVLTSDEIERPFIIVHANVTKTPSHDHDHDDGDEESQREVMTILGTNTNQVSHHGLHLDILDDDDNLKVTIWANKHVHNQDNHGHDHDHHPDDHHHHHRHFCASVEAFIVLPKSFTKFGSLSIVGTIMDVNMREISGIEFERLFISNAIGDITVHDKDGDSISATTGIVSKDLYVYSSTGFATVPHFTGPEGSPVKANITTVIGSIGLNIVLPQITSDAGNQRHEIFLSTVTGSIKVNAKPVQVDEEEPSKKIYSSVVPGEVSILAETNIGQIQSFVDLADHQVLYLRAQSVLGPVSSVINDKFLGNIHLETSMGSIKVAEAEGSASQIEYEKYSSHLMVGRKHLKEKEHEDEEEEEGNIDISSQFGVAELIFE